MDGLPNGRGSSKSSACSWDALTTYGIRVWRPDFGSWREISIQGHAHEPRPVPTMAGPRIPRSGLWEPNELIDGSVIDIAGVSLLFQSPMTALRKLSIEPAHMIHKLNSLKPQCPVLMHTIKFVHMSSKERVSKAAHRMESAGEGAFHVPAVDYSDIEEDRRPYVFPACGHVHAYSRALEGR